VRWSIGKKKGILSLLQKEKKKESSLSAIVGKKREALVRRRDTEKARSKKRAHQGSHATPRK